MSRLLKFPVREIISHNRRLRNLYFPIGKLFCSQGPTEPQDQVLFTVDVEAFRQFCALLDGPGQGVNGGPNPPLDGDMLKAAGWEPVFCHRVDVGFERPGAEFQR